MMAWRVIPLLTLCARATGRGDSEEEPAVRVTGGDIRIRDPFILPVEEEGRYYLYGTTTGTEFVC
jgi:hypothetical protein